MWKIKSFDSLTYSFSFSLFYIYYYCTLNVSYHVFTAENFEKNLNWQIEISKFMSKKYSISSIISSIIVITYYVICKIFNTAFLSNVFFFFFLQESKQLKNILFLYYFIKLCSSKKNFKKLRHKINLKTFDFLICRQKISFYTLHMEATKFHPLSILQYITSRL